MTKKYWLLKSEPDEYGWDDLAHESEGVWSGVRNAQAANNLKAMQVGDAAFFYHSRQGLEIVGIVRVSAAYFADPTADDDRWVAIKIKPEQKLARAVTLKAMKANTVLSDMAIIRQPRLSVAPVRPEEWRTVLHMAAS